MQKVHLVDALAAICNGKQRFVVPGLGMSGHVASKLHLFELVKSTVQLSETCNTLFGGLYLSHLQE